MDCSGRRARRQVSHLPFQSLSETPGLSVPASPQAGMHQAHEKYSAAWRRVPARADGSDVGRRLRRPREPTMPTTKTINKSVLGNHMTTREQVSNPQAHILSISWRPVMPESRAGSPCHIDHRQKKSHLVYCIRHSMGEAHTLQGRDKSAHNRNHCLPGMRASACGEYDVAIKPYVACCMAVGSVSNQRFPSFASQIFPLNSQKHCPRAECKQASKAWSQCHWLSKPENRDYFRGPEHVARVQRCREAHPKYWQRDGPKAGHALQDDCTAQPVYDQRDTHGLAAIGARRCGHRYVSFRWPT